MFSVTKTELNVFPLCTKNVWPTKSGVTIERRDHVLIGFFTPELFLLSIFSRRYNSPKAPFFNDLAINVKLQPHPCGTRASPREAATPRVLLRSAPFQHKQIARLIFAP